MVFEFWVNPETLRNWLKGVEIDTGQRPGDDRGQGAAQLEAGESEVRRTDEILKAASALFAKELDR